MTLEHWLLLDAIRIMMMSTSFWIEGWQKEFWRCRFCGEGWRTCEEEHHLDRCNWIRARDAMRTYERELDQAEREVAALYCDAGGEA